MTNKTYDILNTINRRVLPALATLAITLSLIEGISLPGLVIASGVIAAVNTALGQALGNSNTNYKARHSAEESK